jgi:hypothetical protein
MLALSPKRSSTVTFLYGFTVPIFASLASRVFSGLATLLLC